MTAAAKRASEAERLSEGLHRVIAARRNVAAVAAGRLDTDVLRETVDLLDSAAKWLEGSA